MQLPFPTSDGSQVYSKDEHKETIANSIKLWIKLKSIGYDMTITDAGTDIQVETGVWANNTFYKSPSITVSYNDTPHHHEAEYEYKWTDEDGTTKTTKSPPGPGIDYDKIETKPAETTWDSTMTAMIGGTVIAQATSYGRGTKESARDYACIYAKTQVSYAFKVTKVQIKENNTQMQPLVILGEVTENNGGDSIKLPGKDINMFIGGNVWQDMPSDKIGDFTGVKNGKSLNFAGIQVELYDDTLGSTMSQEQINRQEGRIAITTTDANGNYGFQKLNPLHKYHIGFIYDGMRYQDTKYENNLSGGYSTAEENNMDLTRRERFNQKFASIDSTPNNYKDGRGNYQRAYGLYAKLEDSRRKLYTI